jgi:hypothetical protein
LYFSHLLPSCTVCFHLFIVLLLSCRMSVPGKQKFLHVLGFIIVVFVFLFLRGQVLLYSPVWLQTVNPPAWAFWELGLQVCTTMPSQCFLFLFLLPHNRHSTAIIKSEEVSIIIVLISPLRKDRWRCAKDWWQNQLCPPPRTPYWAFPSGARLVVLSCGAKGAGTLSCSYVIPMWSWWTVMEHLLTSL